MANRTNTLGSIIGIVVGVAVATGATVAVREMRHHDGADVAAQLHVAADQRPRVARLLDEEMGPLMHDPNFLDVLQTRLGPHPTEEQARTYGQTLTARGMARLPLVELDNIERIRSVLATQSPAICAGLWSGNTSADAVGHGMEALGDEDLRQLLRISTHAALLELHANSPMSVDPGALRAGLDAISSHLAPVDRTQFESTIQAGTNASPEAGCAAILTIFRTAPQLDPATREGFWRSMSSVMAGG